MHQDKKGFSTLESFYFPEQLFFQTPLTTNIICLRSYVRVLLALLPNFQKVLCNIQAVISNYYTFDSLFSVNEKQLFKPVLMLKMIPAIYFSRIVKTDLRIAILQNTFENSHFQAISLLIRLFPVQMRKLKEN